MSKLISLSWEKEKLEGSITLPISKSESNRAMILDYLSGGAIGALQYSDARDSKVLKSALDSVDDTVNIKDAGTAMRFLLSAFVAKGRECIMEGEGRMHERPIGDLVEALNSLGADVRYLGKEGYPPLQIVKSEFPRSSRVRISGAKSSQFISSLMLIAPFLAEGLEIVVLDKLSSRPYVELTLSILKRFGVECEWEGPVIRIRKTELRAKKIELARDWSSAAYWFSACALLPGSDLLLNSLSFDSAQADEAVVEMSKHFGLISSQEPGGIRVTKSGQASSHPEWSFADCPDLAPTMMALIASQNREVRISGIESLRLKESDRIHSMRSELAKCSINLEDDGDGTVLISGNMQAPDRPIETHGDHRIAMSFAALVFRFGSITIEDPDVVSKSFPDFWGQLEGLGVQVKLT